MDPIKPSWKTLEFWKYAAVIVLGALAMFGAISPEDKSSLEVKALDTVERVFGMITALIAAWKFGDQRKQLKVAALEAEAKVEAEAIKTAAAGKSTERPWEPLVPPPLPPNDLSPKR